MLKQQVISDIERFSDLDSTMTFREEGADLILAFRQQGEDVTLRVAMDGGRVVEDKNGQTSRYGSYRGLLMSPSFGNLKRLVDASLAFLKREAPYVFNIDDHLPIVGSLDSVDQSTDSPSLLADADTWLKASPEGAPVRALVIDGPAGIGKTHLIRRLVVERATAFRPGSAPPILHVQSKGKKLSTLDDVLAGTLNALRLSLTNEQVPVLIRNGLLHLAIDGFDELADPAGYETAWGSVVDLVNDVAGQGALILAGRDTFLDVNSIKSAVMALDTPSTASIHLRPLSKGEATAWLHDRISTENINELRVAGLLEEGSYALRPLFVNELSRLGDEDFDSQQFLTFPLKSLVESIIAREARILENSLRSEGELSVHDLLELFFREVSRFMADAESDSIEISSIDLIAEIVFTDKVREDEVAMMRHRASALALLEQDGSTSRRRFPHTEIQDYFLSGSYIELIALGNVPKSVRRNILGGDFLETFHDVASSTAKTLVAKWRSEVMQKLRVERFPDRTIQNLGAMALATSDIADTGESENRIENCAFDEVCMRGTVGETNLSYVQIAHFDVRGADISSVIFENCVIGTLLADETSVLPYVMPSGPRLYVEKNNRPIAIYNTNEIEQWIKGHTKTIDQESSSDRIKLLEKLCRVVLRQHWIREIEEDRAGRLLEDPSWPSVKAALESRDLLRVRDSVAAGGPRSRFLRVEKAGAMLAPRSDDADVTWVRQVLA